MRKIPQLSPSGVMDMSKRERDKNASPSGPKFQAFAHLVQENRNWCMLVLNCCTGEASKIRADRTVTRSLMAWQAIVSFTACGVVIRR